MVDVTAMRVGSDVTDFVTDSHITGGDITIAIVIMLLAWIVAGLARRGVLGVLGKVQGVSIDLRQLAARLTRYFVLLLGFGVALTFLGAPIQPLLSAAIVVAVVAALALRGVAENFAAGVVIQTRRPMQLGDRIEALQHRGVVREMNGRSVVIETDDGRTVHLPNGKVLDNPLVNSSTNSARRSEIEVRSTGTDDIDAAIATIGGAAAQAAGVLTDPAPTVTVRGVQRDHLVVLVRVWHDPAEEASVVSAVIRMIDASERRLGRVATVVTPPSSAVTASAKP